MADLKLDVTFTCGLQATFGRKDGEVMVKLPAKQFTIEPAKAKLIAGVLTLLADYPENP